MPLPTDVGSSGAYNALIAMAIGWRQLYGKIVTAIDMFVVFVAELDTGRVHSRVDSGWLGQKNFRIGWVKLDRVHGQKCQIRNLS